MSESVILSVTATLARADAVRYDGANVHEVHQLCSRAPAPGDDVPIPVEPYLPLIRLWDARTCSWRYANPGCWVLADEHGVAVFDDPWFRILFTGHAEWGAGQLYTLSTMADHLQDVVSHMRMMVAAPAATAEDEALEIHSGVRLFDAFHPSRLRTVTLGQDGPERDRHQFPYPGDQWRDGTNVIWTLQSPIHATDPLESYPCRDAYGNEAAWSQVQAARSTMTPVLDRAMSDVA